MDQAADAWSRQARRVVALCFVLNMVDGMDLLALTYVAPALQREWSVGPGVFAFAFSAGLAGMALGGLGLAPLADRIGRRRMVMASLAAMSAAMLASSMARSVPELAACRLVVGTGIGTVLACIAAIAAQAAPVRHRNFAVGVLQAGYPIGAMMTGFAAAWAVPRLGWQSVMIASAVISALCIPLVRAVLPPRLPAAKVAARASVAEIFAGDRRRATLLLWAAAICGFMALYFITSWIARLAIEAGLPETQAIIASAVYNFGAFSGTVGMSIAGTRWDVRRIGSALLAAAAGVFLVFGGVGMPLVGVLVTAWIMGVTLQGGFNALYPVAARVYPDAVRAGGVGFAMGIGRIGAFTGPLIGGLALAAQLPLVGVFGIFCVPLLIAAWAVRRVPFGQE